MKSLLTLVFLVCCTIAVTAQAYPDRHTTNWDDAWISCEISDSPNAKRDPGHWIMYDLGDQYSLQQSTIWNNNVPGETARGLNQVVIDYSSDGENWTELGTYGLVEGPGSTIYQGDEGPDFSGAIARFVLISALSNHGGDCYSLSEIKINASVATTTSFAQSELTIDMKVAPNPAQSVTQIVLDQLPEGQVRYQLTDATGRLYLQGSMTDTQMSLDISMLAAGTYTFTLYNEAGIKSQPITVISQK